MIRFDETRGALGARFALATLTLVLGLGLLAPGVSAWGWEPPTPCERTAWRMFSACMIDTHEELNIAIANCLNISDWAERWECRHDARAVREEEQESCGEQKDARLDVCDLLDEYRYDPDPLLANDFVHPDDIPDFADANPLHSLEAGLVNVLRAGEDGEEVVVILNTDETLEIQGVECRIVAEVALEVEEEEEEGVIEYDYTPVEMTFDFFAQTEDGDVIYCGEYTVEYEDGFPVSTDGTFIAGVEMAKSGTLVRADAEVGDADRQEYALDEAEDYIVYEDLAATPPDEFGGENEAFECDGECTQTRDGTPLEPDSIEWKYYLPGAGFVLALPFELNDDDEFEWTGEREELVCRGDTLDILIDDCDIEDPDELFEELCGIAGEYFCDD